MTRFAAGAVAGCFSFLLCSSVAQPHPGRLDANGCHYEKAGSSYHCHQEVPPNTDVTAVAKKSRDNICHDASSPNYRTVRYFIAYRSLKDCLSSGGRRPMQ